LSLNPEQRAAVQHVHLFVQQYYLEQMGIKDNISELKFSTRVFTLTFRHSDWWSWESPPESTDKLGICPWVRERTSSQTMLAQPLSPALPDLKATMIKGTWGWQIGQIERLEVLRIEFETDITKKKQLDAVLERAKHWRFPVHGVDAVLETNGKIVTSEWTGPAHLKQDSTAAMLRSTRGSGSDDLDTAMRTKCVAEMTWKKRKLSAGEVS
jgi:hypothetical protein